MWREGDTQERETLQGRGEAGTLVGNKTIHVKPTYMEDGEILQNSNADNKCLNGVNLQKQPQHSISAQQVGFFDIGSRRVRYWKK